MYSSDNMALFYLKDDNVFMDGEGEIVFEIFEAISPNDLYLFKRNKKYTVVNHHSLPGSFVELYWPEEEYEERFFDVGDDYERIERYEKARLSGCFTF
ncbi:MAG: hypothetical protein M0P29_14165 [Sphaerochaetaceae bacterium]|nr:hypothetical protein [Sphaerochaetaceae bacterium]